MKKRIMTVLSVLLMFCVLTMNASAAYGPDLSRAGSISITMTYQSEPISGGSLTLYRVADVYVTNGVNYSFRYTGDYKNCSVYLSNLGHSSTAWSLAEYTRENHISGTKIWIDDSGKAYFPDLELGLYLLVQEDAADGYNIVNPFLVTVPGRENGSYVYDVDASPKMALEPMDPPPEETDPPPPEETDPPPEETDPPPEETDPPPPDIPELPQTGLTKWPIPVLAVMGLLLVVLGWYLCIVGRKKSHEN